MNLDNRPKIIAILAVFAAMIMITSYVFVLSSDAEGYEGAVDAMGNRLTFDSVPERIISTAPSITETVHALGYDDKLVGVSQNCDFPASLVAKVDSGDIKTLGAYNNPNREEIINLTADVVFITQTAGGTSAYNHLKNAGEKVVLLFQEKTMQDIYMNLMIIAKTMQDEESAMAVQQSMMQTFNTVGNLSSQGDNPKVMLNLGFAWGLGFVYAYGSQTFGNDIVNMANGTNVITANGFVLVNLEFIETEAGNPDIIIAMVQGGQVFTQDDWNSTMDTLRNNPNWGNTTAVQNDDVYFFYGRAASIAQRAGPAMEDFSKLALMYLQPELFEGFVPPKYIGDDYADLFEGHW